MTDRFIALGLPTAGDSFYCEWEGIDGVVRRALVDGGLGKGLRLSLTEQVEVGVGSILDVVICTHADADHVTGLIDLFSTGGYSREVWVPAKWIALLEKASENWEEFCGELWNDISARKDSLDIVSDEASKHGRTALEEIAEGIGDLSISSTDCREGESLDWDRLELVAPRRFSDEWLDQSSYFQFVPGSASPVTRLFLDAIETHNKIRSLVKLARQNGAVIRWFEYQKTGSQAVDATNDTRPHIINARTAFRPDWRKVKPLDAICLTQINRESLVAYIPSRDARPAVLFSGDSDFSFDVSSNRIPQSCAIVTVAHHGAEENAQSRTETEAIFGKEDVTWIRSDNTRDVWKPRPATWYMGIASSQRYCTLCRGDKVAPQTVQLRPNNGAWGPVPGVRPCSCVLRSSRVQAGQGP